MTKEIYDKMITIYREIQTALWDTQKQKDTLIAQKFNEIAEILDPKTDLRDAGYVKKQTKNKRNQTKKSHKINKKNKTKNKRKQTNKRNKKR